MLLNPVATAQLWRASQKAHLKKGSSSVQLVNPVVGVKSDLKGIDPIHGLKPGRTSGLMALMGVMKLGELGACSEGAGHWEYAFEACIMP